MILVRTQHWKLPMEAASACTGGGEMEIPPVGTKPTPAPPEVLAVSMTTAAVAVGLGASNRIVAEVASRFGHPHETKPGPLCLAPPC